MLQLSYPRMPRVRLTPSLSRFPPPAPGMLTMQRRRYPLPCRRRLVVMRHPAYRPVRAGLLLPRPSRLARTRAVLPGQRRGDLVLLGFRQVPGLRLVRRSARRFPVRRRLPRRVTYRLPAAMRRDRAMCGGSMMPLDRMLVRDVMVRLRGMRTRSVMHGGLVMRNLDLDSLRMRGLRARHMLNRHATLMSVRLEHAVMPALMRPEHPGG